MQGPSNLCSGYTNVEGFGPDEDYESEEEIQYVTLDLGDIEPQLVPSSTTYRLIENSPTPYLQLHGTVMKGRQTSLLGTELLFTDDKEIHDWNKRPVKYVAKTEQRIVFQEVTLIPKTVDSKANGKGRASTPDGISESVPYHGEAISSGLLPNAGDQAARIDTLTGVVAPSPTRASRQKKGITTSSRSPARSKKRGAASKVSRSTKSAKAKGKEKEVPLPEAVMTIDEDVDAYDPGDNAEDIYMED